MHRAILGYIYECRAWTTSAELRYKIAQLDALRRRCFSFPGPPGPVPPIAPKKAPLPQYIPQQTQPPKYHPIEKEDCHDQIDYDSPDGYSEPEAPQPIKKPSLPPPSPPKISPKKQDVVPKPEKKKEVPVQPPAPAKKKEIAKNDKKVTRPFGPNEKHKNDLTDNEECVDEPAGGDDCEEDPDEIVTPALDG